MRTILKKEFNEIEAVAIEKGIAVRLLETELEEVIFVVSEGKTICLTSFKSEERELFVCYKVDINKLLWAEEEGFRTADGFILGVEKEILHLFESRRAYFKYLNLL